MPNSLRKTWESMIRRCQNPADKDFHRYGARGIKVCERWMSYANFVADMNPRPTGKTLDRINNDGHYEPSNCRWATRREQDNNRRSNHRITFNGETKTIAEWARATGIKVGRLYDRLITEGWTVERALSERDPCPARGSLVNTSKLTAEQVTALRADRDAGMSLPKLGRKYGITAQAAWRICRREAWGHIP